MKQIQISEPAERDLDEIWNYLARKAGDIETADQVITSITAAFAVLEQSPGAGAKRGDIEPGVRGFPAGNYIVYYRESATSVVVTRVLHGMRDQRAAYRASN